MTVQIQIFGNQFGLDHNGQPVANTHPNLTGYDVETLCALEGLAKTTITSAELLALNATPKIIVPAPPTGFANILNRMALYKPAGTAYAGIAAGEDLVAKYTGTSGQQISAYVETTGFLDQTTAQPRFVRPISSNGTTTAGDVTPVEAAAIVLHLLTGEITTGTGGLIVWTWFSRIPTVLTA